MEKLKTHEFFEHVSHGELAPAYLLTGEELYFMDRALTRIISRALAGAPRDFNLDVYYGKETKADEVVSQASTLPIMAERRVVVVKETERMRDFSSLKEYLKSPSPETVLVLVAMNADRAKERSLTEAMPGEGVVAHFYHPFESELPRLIKVIARDAGFTIDDSAAGYLKDVLGGNLALIEAELNKVLNLISGRKNVTLVDVKDAVGDFGVPLVFDLIDAAASKKPAEAMEILERLIRDGEQPLMLLAMLASHWRKLVEMKGGKRPAGRQFKPVKGTDIPEDELIRAFYLFRKADADLKSSPLPPRMVMERLVLELSGAGIKVVKKTA